MAHTYMLFDFGAGEERAQQALRKLQGWKQAFRLDKKLQFKFDRAETTPSTEPTAPEEPKGKSKAAKKAKPAPSAAQANGNVTLLVRLYFSPHEKLSEQRWLDRIPAEEPFKDASAKVVTEGDPQFEDLVGKFDALD